MSLGSHTASNGSAGVIPMADDSRVSQTVVVEAVAEVMRASSPVGAYDRALAEKIGGDIRPAIQKALTGKIGSGSELVSLSTFRTILAQHLGSPAGNALDEQTRKATLHTLETANRYGAEFAGLVARGVNVAALGHLSPEAAREVATRGDNRRSSTEFNVAFNGGPYTASNLSGEMKSYVDSAHGISAAHVAGVGNYLHGVGISAQQYTGYFVGSSDTARKAIQDHIQNGGKVTDAHIQNPNDVKAVIGAIKAGKMKKEDAPPSVQKIMEDMEKKGIDPAKTDPKALEKYFKDNPKALEAVKKEVQADVGADKGLKAEQKEVKNRQAEKLAAQSAALPKLPPKIAPKEKTSALDL